jgi:hypothetical protein
MTEEFRFHVGDRVKKYSGDVQFYGEVRACYHTKAGKARYVVETEAYPLQLIYSHDQLRIANQLADDGVSLR